MCVVVICVLVSLENTLQYFKYFIIIHHLKQSIVDYYIRLKKDYKTALYFLRLKSLLNFSFFVFFFELLFFSQNLYRDSRTTFKMEEQSLDCRWCPTKTPEFLFKSRRQQRGPESQKWGGGGRGRFTAAKCWRAWGRFWGGAIAEEKRMGKREV